MSWWSESGEQPPNDWPIEARQQAIASAALSAAGDVIEGALPGERVRLQRGHLAGTVVLAETLLPALDADQLEQLLEQLDPDTRRTVPTLLRRAGWTIGDDGRLRPPPGQADDGPPRGEGGAT